MAGSRALRPAALAAVAATLAGCERPPLIFDLRPGSPEGIQIQTPGARPVLRQGVLEIETPRGFLHVKLAPSRLDMGRRPLLHVQVRHDEPFAHTLAGYVAARRVRPGRRGELPSEWTVTARAVAPFRQGGWQRGEDLHLWLDLSDVPTCPLYDAFQGPVEGLTLHLVRTPPRFSIVDVSLHQSAPLAGVVGRLARMASPWGRASGSLALLAMAVPPILAYTTIRRRRLAGAMSKSAVVLFWLAVALWSIASARGLAATAGWARAAWQEGRGLSVEELHARRVRSIHPDFPELLAALARSCPPDGVITLRGGSDPTFAVHNARYLLVPRTVQAGGEAAFLAILGPEDTVGGNQVSSRAASCPSGYRLLERVGTSSVICRRSP